MTFLEQAQAWDGKGVGVLRQLFQDCCHEEHFLSQAIDLCCKDGNAQIAGAWMVKQHLDDGGFLDELEIERWVASFQNADIWTSYLLMLQGMVHIPIPPQSRGMAEVFVRRCLEMENKFIRAWAYHCFYHLSRIYPDLKREADSLMEVGLETEAASVRASIRQALRKTQA
jgi:hypothetical protein